MFVVWWKRAHVVKKGWTNGQGVLLNLIAPAQFFHPLQTQSSRNTKMILNMYRLYSINVPWNISWIAVWIGIPFEPWRQQQWHDIDRDGFCKRAFCPCASVHCLPAAHQFKSSRNYCFGQRQSVYNGQLPKPTWTKSGSHAQERPCIISHLKCVTICPYLSQLSTTGMALAMTIVSANEAWLTLEITNEWLYINVNIPK